MDHQNEGKKQPVFLKAFAGGILGALFCNALLVFGAAGAGALLFTSHDVRNKIGDVFSRYTDAGRDAIPVLTDSTGEENAVVSVVEKVNPAVVSIVITKDVPIIEQYYDNSSNPFGGAFNFSLPQYRQNGTEEREVGGGSGFFVSDDGYVVTNAHVVSDEDASYTVFSNDGTKYEAEVIAKDTVLDIALLKVEGTDLPYLTFGDSSGAKVGQTVIAIGNALGEYRNTVSVGVISGLSRSVAATNGSNATEVLSDVLQTDAAINPGNSGGPLIDLSGQVIGVNVAASVGSAENIGFSLPGNEVEKAIDSIKENGRVVRPYLGVRYIPVTKELKKTNALSVDYGVLIVRGQKRGDLAVIPGSPADKAGLEENDIILSVNGKKLTEEVPLQNVLHTLNVGDTITLHILHDGDEKDVKVKLEENKTS
jgi:serine protease Do